MFGITGKGDFYSSTDILFGKDSLTIYVNERFKLPSSSQATTRSTFASLISRMVTLRRLVYVFTSSDFSSNLLFHCLVRDFIQDNGVCNVLIETDHTSELSQGKTWRCGDQLFRFLDRNFCES